MFRSKEPLSLLQKVKSLERAHYDLYLSSRNRLVVKLAQEQHSQGNLKEKMIAQIISKRLIEGLNKDALRGQSRLTWEHGHHLDKGGLINISLRMGKP